MFLYFPHEPKKACQVCQHLATKLFLRKPSLYTHVHTTTIATTYILPKYQQSLLIKGQVSVVGVLPEVVHMRHFLINSIHVQLLTTSIPAKQPIFLSFFSFLTRSKKSPKREFSVFTPPIQKQNNNINITANYYTFLVTITIIVINRDYEFSFTRSERRSGPQAK